MSTHSISRRTEQVPIFQGDDTAAIEQARQDFNRAEAEVPGFRSQSRRLMDTTAVQKVQEAAEAYDAVVAEALPRAVMATVQALGRKTYRKLLAEHPPREDNEADQVLGFNESTFLDAVLEYYDPETGEKSIVAPEFNARQPLVDWLDNLNDGTFAQLGTAAVRVNEGGSPDPKASLGSRVATLLETTSRSLDSTASEDSRRLTD